MANSNSGLSCAAGCWLLAAGAGVVALILMLTMGSAGIIGSIFLSGVIFVVLGLLFGFLFCRELPQPGAAVAGAAKPAPAARTPTPAPASEPAPASPATAAEPAAPASAVKSGTQLPGEEELASRKGEWKYEGDADAPKAAPKAAVSDGGSKPEGLSEPRGGKADNLKEIKGVGPKLEKLLNSMGFYHFDQIANWGPAEVAWVDENLEGFKGRVTRDNWVEQAQTLAAGGETEFSKRVEDGDVY